MSDTSSKPVFIPGLPVTNLKRPPKKRRKKKGQLNQSASSNSVSTLLTTVTSGAAGNAGGGGSADHRGSISSSEAGNSEKNNVLQGAITILQREESPEEPEASADATQDGVEIEDADATDDLLDEPTETTLEDLDEPEIEPEITEPETLIPEDANVLVSYFLLLNFFLNHTNTSEFDQAHQHNFF